MWSSPKAAALFPLWLAACLPEFHPNLGDDSTASTELSGCGVQGAPCCSAPDEPCEGELLCDPESAVCMRRPVLLCGADAECRQGEVCCAAGLVGTCEAVAKEDCPTLDLVVAAPELDARAVESRVFDPSVESDRCLIERGCVGGPGLRRLLRVSTAVSNVGDADLLLGSPEATLAPTITTCEGEPRFAAFLRYELVDSTGPQARQDVPASCSARASGRFVAPFDCDFQGLWNGFSQSYDATAMVDGGADGCRWLDITELLPGEYTLRVTVNPDGLLPEQNLSNNTPTELPIVIPAFDDPSAPCPEPANPLLGSFAERECGWVRAAFQSEGLTTACTPGEYVPLTCTSDNVDFVCGDYRVCSGPDSCSYAEATPSSQDICYLFGGPNASLICPATGRYSLWIQRDNPDGFSCEPHVDAFFETLSVPDAGAPADP